MSCVEQDIMREALRSRWHDGLTKKAKHIKNGHLSSVWEYTLCLQEDS